MLDFRGYRGWGWRFGANLNLDRAKKLGTQKSDFIADAGYKGHKNQVSREVAGLVNDTGGNQLNFLRKRIAGCFMEVIGTNEDVGVQRKAGSFE